MRAGSGRGMPALIPHERRRTCFRSFHLTMVPPPALSLRTSPGGTRATRAAAAPAGPGRRASVGATARRVTVVTDARIAHSYSRQPPV